MKKPERVTKTKGDDARSPQRMAEQPLSPRYKRGTVTSEGRTALSFCRLSPRQQRDHPGSHQRHRYHHHRHPPLRNRSRGDLPQGTYFHLGKANREKLPILLLLEPGRRRNSAGTGRDRCRASSAVKALGAPLLRATGIEALYTFIKENLYWTSKLLSKQRSLDVLCVHGCLMWERFKGQVALIPSSTLHRGCPQVRWDGGTRGLSWGAGLYCNHQLEGLGALSVAKKAE